MSILIAICVDDHVLLAADTRLTTHDKENEIEYINDDYHKVFRLNDNLLFGCGGQFFYNEPLTAPFIIKDTSTLSLEDADTCIHEYMNVVFEKMPPFGNRSYILCGRNQDGNMCLYHYYFNLATQEQDCVKHNSAESDKGYSCIGLPPKLTKDTDKYLRMIENILDSSTCEQDIKNGVSKIINSVAEIDVTVGGTPEIITL